MGSTIESQLSHCLELLAKIREEYPEGDFDREMLHGDMDFRYRQIKEDREKLEEFPQAIRDFARLIDSLATPHQAVKRFLHSVRKEPQRFSGLATIPFQQRKEQLEEWATELDIGARSINELLTRTRLAGILDSSYNLHEGYREIVSAYLNLAG